MNRRLVPLPPKVLIFIFGIISFISFLGVVFGQYSFFSIESGNYVYTIKGVFTQDKKFKANEFFEYLKSEGFDPELVAVDSFVTENRGFIVTVNFEGKDREFLAGKINEILSVNGFKGTVETSEVNSDVVRVKVGNVFQKESDANSYLQKVINATQVTFIVEPNKVVVGEQKLFAVTLKTRDRFIAEDYKKIFTQHGYSPEIIKERIKNSR